MSKTFIWFGRQLKMTTIILLSTFIFIACADDQDATTVSSDSTVKNSTGNKGDTIPAEKADFAGRKKEPHDLPDAAVTRLALKQSEANQYRHGTQFITVLPNNVDAAQLENLKYGRWYKIENLPHPFNVRNKDRLTNNIYGYLTYHDMVIKYPTGPHTVFLQWFANGANIDSVIVWINPGPTYTKDEQGVLLLSDPPRPRVPPPPPME